MRPLRTFQRWLRPGIPCSSASAGTGMAAGRKYLTTRVTTVGAVVSLVVRLGRQIAPRALCVVVVAAFESQFQTELYRGLSA